MARTTVRGLHCPTCGDQTLPATALTLHLRPAGSTYTYVCPCCADPVTRPATPDVVTLFTRAGVRTVRIPAEATEAHHGPPIGYDDILDLHQQLTQA